MSRRSTVSEIGWDGPLTSYHEGLILGNGDLGAVAYGNQWEFKLTLGKNDVWDARFDSDAEADILKHDDLIELIEEYGVEAFRGMQSGALALDRPDVDAATGRQQGRAATPAYYDKVATAVPARNG